jgi:nucleotide-binding universal stress UspA family protein
VRGPARPFRKVLVATDFGPSSARAVDLAARIGGLFGARVTLLHALDDEAGDPTDEISRAARARLTQIADGKGDVLVRHGKPWSEIADEANKDYDLVVVGTHGRKALPRWLLGSVAEKVVRSADPPVLIVRGNGAS